MPFSPFIFFYLTSFLADATTMLVQPLLAIHMTRVFHPSAWQLGLLGTVNGVGYALCSYWSGKWSDKTGRRVWMLIGAGAHFFGCLLLPLCHSLAAFMLVAMFQFSVLGCLWPSLMGWMSELTPPRALPRSISRWNMTWCLGTIAGSFSGGALYDHISWRAPFIAGVCCMIPVLLLYSLGRPLPAADAPPGTPIPATHARAARFTWQAWLTLAGSMFLSNLLVYLFPKILELGNEVVVAQKIGSQHGVRLSAMFCMFWLMGSTTRWHFRRWPAPSVFALLCAVAGAAAFTHREASFFAVFFALGVAMGAAYGLSVYYSMMMPAKGHMGGMHEALMSSGAMCGPFFGGAAIQLTQSSRATFLACLVPLTVLWIVTARLGWRLPPPEREGATAHL